MPNTYKLPNTVIEPKVTFAVVETFCPIETVPVTLSYITPVPAFIAALARAFV